MLLCSIGLWLFWTGSKDYAHIVQCTQMSTMWGTALHMYMYINACILNIIVAIYYTTHNFVDCFVATKKLVGKLPSRSGSWAMWVITGYIYCGGNRVMGEQAVWYSVKYSKSLIGVSEIRGQVNTPKLRSCNYIHITCTRMHIHVHVPEHSRLEFYHGRSIWREGAYI